MKIGIWELLVILVIVVLLFGTKRLKTLGTDLGSAIKGFRSAVRDPDQGGDSGPPAGDPKKEGRVLDEESIDRRHPPA